MGNYLSCSEAMKDYMIQDTLLYKLRHMISLVITGLIWFFFIRNYEIQLNKKYIIIPIIIFIFISNIINTLLTVFIEYFVIKKDKLNKLIDKCISWQNANEGICDSSYQGVCIVNPKIIIDWNEFIP
jgi:hypothetical protein